MRIPQSAERLKEAPAQVLRAVLAKEAPAQQALRAMLSKETPAQALRAVFSGVGQVLLVTEKVRQRARGNDRETAPAPPAAPVFVPAAPASAASAAPAAAAETVAAETAAPAKPAAGKSAPGKPRASKATAGTAKSSTAKATAAKAATAKASTAKASTAKGSTAKSSTAKSSTAKESTAKSGAAAASNPRPAGTPPIPDYPELSVASLRARMRGLDAGQLSELLGYERAHENRDNVVAMFERRIAKLEQEGPASTG